MAPDSRIAFWIPVCLIWTALAAWSMPAGRAEAGTIDARRTPACDVRFTGDLEPGDAQRLVAALKAVDTSRAPGPRLRSEQEIENDIYLPRLCLDSKGGSFDEAVTFIRATISKMSFATVVEKGAECYSACALVFLTGHHNQGDGYVELYRRMHVDGQVGFHAPFLPAIGAAPAEQLSRSYRAGVEAVAELLNLDQRFFPRSLLAEFLKVGPEKFFKVEEVRQLVAWDIGLVGYRRNRAVAAGQIERACRHRQLRNDSVYYPRFFPQWLEDRPDEALGADGRKRVEVGPTMTRHVADAMGAEAASKCVTHLQMHGNVLFMSVDIVSEDPGPSRRRTFVSDKVARNTSQADPDTYAPAYFLYAGRTKISALPREGQ